VERLGDDNCDIYCYQDNMFDITKTMNERWWTCIGWKWGINWLLQVKLWQDYEILMIFVKKEHIEEIDLRKELDAKIREWTLYYNSL
jgi:hypothetical protein